MHSSVIAVHPDTFGIRGSAIRWIEARFQRSICTAIWIVGDAQARNETAPLRYTHPT